MTDRQKLFDALKSLELLNEQKISNCRCNFSCIKWITYG